MFIKLMPDQVTCFWSIIKHGMIESFEVPKEFQQDFAIRELKNLLSGLSQCWVGTEIDEANNRKICFVMTSKITEDRNYGIKTLFVDSIYSIRLITDELSNEAYKCMVESPYCRIYEVF